MLIWLCCIQLYKLSLPFIFHVMYGIIIHHNTNVPDWSWLLDESPQHCRPFVHKNAAICVYNFFLPLKSNKLHIIKFGNFGNRHFGSFGHGHDRGVPADGFHVEEYNYWQRILILPLEWPSKSSRRRTRLSTEWSWIQVSSAPEFLWEKISLFRLLLVSLRLCVQFGYCTGSYHVMSYHCKIFVRFCSLTSLPSIIFLFIFFNK